MSEPSVPQEAAKPGPPEELVVSVALDIAVVGQQMHLDIKMAAAPESAAALIPIARGLQEAVAGRMNDVVAAGGRSVSCRKGCGACCRQAAPISIAEARALHALVAAMPEPRRSAVRSRFAAARETLAAAGLLDAFSGRTAAPKDELRQLDRRYRALGMPCPFLEDESCSIHLERPLVCREYLVTSPPAACSNLDGSGVQCVPIPAAVSTAMMATDPETTAAGSQWIAIATALEWVDANPAQRAALDGEALLRRFLSHFLQRELPASGGSMLDSAR